MTAKEWVRALRNYEAAEIQVEGWKLNREHRQREWEALRKTWKTKINFLQLRTKEQNQAMKTRLKQMEEDVAELDRQVWQAQQKARSLRPPGLPEDVKEEQVLFLIRYFEGGAAQTIEEALELLGRE